MESQYWTPTQLWTPTAKPVVAVILYRSCSRWPWYRTPSRDHSISRQTCLSVLEDIPFHHCCCHQSTFLLCLNPDALASDIQDSITMASWCNGDVERCKHCGEPDYQEGFGPRTLLICDCCQIVGAHLKCEERAACIKLSADICNAGHKWYCEQVTLP